MSGCLGLEVVGGQGGLEGIGVTAKGYRISFWVNENVLKLTVMMGAQLQVD